MTAKIRVNCGKVWIEVDADTVKDAMQQLSAYQEVFSGHACGHCGKDDFLYQHRQDAEGHDYYSLECVVCEARLDFGQHKNQRTLFAKHKDAEGNYDKEHQGWYHWQDRKKETI